MTTLEPEGVGFGVVCLAEEEAACGDDDRIKGAERWKLGREAKIDGIRIICITA